MATLLDRRSFLKVSAAAGGGLVVGGYLSDFLGAPTMARAAGVFAPNVWVKIAADDTVTMTLTMLEMGQGVMTSMPMLVAEELDIDWNKIKTEWAPADAKYGNPGFGGMRAYAQRAGEDVAGTLGFLRVFYGLGRLRADAGVGRATDELSALARRAQPSIVAGATSGVVVTPVKSFLQGPARPVLWTMFGGTLLMVLLACSSVAGVQVFRAARADRTLAIQLALGAPRRRLIARAVLEGAFLSAAGLAGAIVIGFWSTRWLIASAPLDVPRLADARVASWPVLLFMSTTTVGFPVATTASSSCCCTPGKSSESASEPSPTVPVLNRPARSPTHTTATSAAFAAATAAGMRSVRVEIGEG